VAQALFFETGKYEALIAKIKEFNDSFAEEDTAHRMDSVELMHFDEALLTLSIGTRFFV